MAAGAADIVVKFLHDLAGALDVTDIAHRNDHPLLYQTGDNGPFNAFDLQTELRHLWNYVLAIDLAHMNHGHTVVHLKSAERPPQGFEILARQRRPFDTRD